MTNINIRSSVNGGYVVEDYLGLFVFKTYVEMIAYLDGRLNASITLVSTTNGATGDACGSLEML